MAYNLGHVENDSGRDETDTDTGNEATSDNGTESSRGRGDHLDDNTDGVDDTAGDDSPLATNHVGAVTGDDSAKEGTGGEDRDDERLVGVGEGLLTRALDGLDEDGVAVDTVDVTGVVTEEDTTKRGKGAHHVGLPGDGGLDGLDRLGGVEGGDMVGLLDDRALGLKVGRHGERCVVCVRLVKRRG